jgi:hypothetical protein
MKTHFFRFECKQNQNKSTIWATASLHARAQLKYLIFELWMFFETFAYNDKIQIAFSAHPLLRIKLEQASHRGSNKTTAYYTKWENLENGQRMGLH